LLINDYAKNAIYCWEDDKEYDWTTLCNIMAEKGSRHHGVTRGGKSIKTQETWWWNSTVQKAAAKKKRTLKK